MNPRPPSLCNVFSLLPLRGIILFSALGIFSPQKREGESEEEMTKPNPEPEAQVLNPQQQNTIPNAKPTVTKLEDKWPESMISHECWS